MSPKNALVLKVPAKRETWDLRGEKKRVWGVIWREIESGERREAMVVWASKWVSQLEVAESHLYRVVRFGSGCTEAAWLYLVYPIL